jgi:serine/threonine protein kinase
VRSVRLSWLASHCGVEQDLSRPPTRPARIISNLALTPGARLGVYEITAQIAEGGMGEVFRARDTKLNRDVALKVLPDSFARLRTIRTGWLVLRAVKYGQVRRVGSLEARHVDVAVIAATNRDLRPRRPDRAHRSLQNAQSRFAQRPPASTGGHF